MTFVRGVAVVLLGFLLLIIQSALSTSIDLYPFSPNLLLPIVIFLGVSPDIHIVRGAILSFCLGYLLDLFCGNLMSLQTFVSVLTFMLARGAGLRLFLRGPGFQVLLTFVVSVLAGAVTLALRAIFEPPSPFPHGTWVDALVALVAPSLVTALAAPLVFVAVQKAESLSLRRRDETGPGSTEALR